MKWTRLAGVAAFVLLFCAACQPKQKKETTPAVVIGFSQLGQESSWRQRNTDSVLEAAADARYRALYRNGDASQEQQIKQVRSFIISRVDAIVLAPIVETGWSTVLAEAKKAGIPVILNDRNIAASERRYITSGVYTDAVGEGKKAAAFIKKKFADHTGPVRMVQIYGNKDSSVSAGRSQGFTQALAGDGRFQTVAVRYGDFMISKGEEVIRQLAKEIDLKNIDVIFSHNDDMTLGILKYLKTTAIRPGKDIVIVSIDATQKGINALRRGEINADIECNPETGAKVMNLINLILNKRQFEPAYYLEDKVFSEFDSNLSSVQRKY